MMVRTTRGAPAYMVRSGDVMANNLTTHGIGAYARDTKARTRTNILMNNTGPAQHIGNI